MALMGASAGLLPCIFKKKDGGWIDDSVNSSVVDVFMQPGCFQCFENLWMGLKKSKPRRSGHRDYDDGQDGDGFGRGSAPAAVVEHPPSHSDAVTTLAAFSSGVSLSGSADKSVVLYDWKAGSVRQKWHGHSRAVTKVIYAGDMVFSASRDKTIKLWKVGDVSNQSLATFEGHSMVVTAIDLANEEKTLLFSGSRDNSVKLWDVHSGQCVRENEITRNLVTCVKWIPGTTQVAQAGEDKMIRIWDTRSMEPAVTFPPKQYFQTCCDSSGDGRYLLTCSNGFNGSGCEAMLWDIREQKIVHTYSGHVQTTSACVFLPRLSHLSQQELIATASHDSAVRVWDQNTSECMVVEEFLGSGPLTGLAAYNDGSICVSSFNVGIYQMLLKVDRRGLHLTRQRHY